MKINNYLLSNTLFFYEKVLPVSIENNMYIIEVSYTDEKYLLQLLNLLILEYEFKISIGYNNNSILCYSPYETVKILFYVRDLHSIYYLTRNTFVKMLIECIQCQKTLLANNH